MKMFNKIFNTDKSGIFGKGIFGIDDDVTFLERDGNILGTEGSGVVEATIIGTDGDDFLVGTDGNDVIFGLGGDDTIQGDAGSDSMDGGAGNDTLSYVNSTEGVTINLATGLAQGGDAEGDIFQNFEGLFGSNRDDTLTGDAADNTLDGFRGDDILNGGAGDDRLIGGFSTGDDTLIGGTGDDVMSGGNGVSMFNGGDDTFVFNPSHGDDTITDFNSGGSTGDLIDLSALKVDFADIQAVMTQVGDDVVIDTRMFVNDSVHSSITLQDVNLGDMDASDFIF